MVAEYVIQSTVTRLQSMLLKNSSAFHVVHKEVKDLLTDLESINQLTEDAIRKQDKNEQDQKWVMDTEDICYDVEDLLEDWELKVTSNRTGSKNVLNRYLCILCELVSSNKVAREIASLSKRINNLRNHLQQDDPVVGESSTRAPESVERGTTSYVPEKEDYFIHREDREIIESFLNTDDLVIAITGMGGTGKSTLARAIYEDANTVDKFPIRAWVTENQTYERRALLIGILSEIVVFTERHLHLDDVELMELLYKSLKGRRFLIVLDDVWTLDGWESLNRAIPFDKVGSKVLVTTRSHTLANELGANVRVHNMMPLSETKSWILFQRIALADREFGTDPALQIMAMDLVKLLKGLPLAIVVLGGLLAMTNLSEWKVVLQKYLHLLESGSTSGYSYIINTSFSLSYNALPHHLKSCYLYLGHFPEDTLLEAEKLCLLWMAEGIIPLETNELPTVMEEAVSSILDELQYRSMIIVQADEVPTIRLKSCRIHSLLRKFCLEKAKACNYFEVLELRSNILKVDVNFLSSTRKIRRLAVYLDNYEDEHSTNLKQSLKWVMEKADHLRSLLFFSAYHHDEDNPWPKDIPSLKELKFLRILDFNGFNFHTSYLPEGIEEMFKLRYLSIGGCYLKQLPSYIGNLWNLQTLDLRVKASCKMIIPNILWMLEKLRHLYLPDTFETKGDDKLIFSGLKELQILKNFDTRICNAQDLLELIKLQVLGATSSGNNEDMNAVIEFAEKTSACQLILVVRNFHSYSKKRKDIVEKLFGCSSLQSLHIGGYIDKSMLPQISSSGITKLSFSGSELDEILIETLEKLPKLWALVLHDGAYIGTDMVFSDSSFPELRLLQLSGLRKLQTLTIQYGAMPKLATLVIERCHSLKESTDGWDSLVNLQKIQVTGMPKEFEAALQIFQEESAGNRKGISLEFLNDSGKGESAPWAQ